MTLLQTIQYTMKSRFMINMGIMISCYGLLSGFYESIWKHYLNIYLPSPIEYSRFVGCVSCCTGVFTIMMMTTMTFWIDRISWTRLALLTPIIMGGLGGLFFVSIQTRSIIFVSFTGAILTIFVKGSKYALFDPCKELAYIPMCEIIKSKGKAAIEMMSSPIGKSGSNCILQLLLIVFGTLDICAPYIGIIYMMTTGFWIYSTMDMGKIVELHLSNHTVH